jgi:hypothetical protein
MHSMPYETAQATLSAAFPFFTKRFSPIPTRFDERRRITGEET